MRPILVVFLSAAALLPLLTLAAPVSNFRLEILPLFSSPSPSGGGSTDSPGEALLRIFGVAFGPRPVSVFVDGAFLGETTATTDGSFALSQRRLTAGTYVISARSQDSLGKQTLMSATAIITLAPGQTADIGPLLIPPTVTGRIADNTLIMAGEAPPASNVTVTVWQNGDALQSQMAQTDALGRYALIAPAPANRRGLSLVPQAQLGQTISGPGRPYFLSEPPPTECSHQADINGDCAVNLIDYSIAVFWYKKTLSKEMAAVEGQRLNADGLIDLRDFSFIGYYWNP